MTAPKPVEGRAVRGFDAWVDLKQQKEGEWITVAVRGFETSLTPEGAKVLARQLNTLANDMIKRRAPE